MKKTKVAINGYGRIGVCVARIISKRDDVEVVAINSTSDDEMMQYLTKYDSVHWVYDGEVRIEDWYLYLWENTKAKILRDRDPKNLDFGKYGAEVVIEATGQFLTQEKAKAHIKDWVKKVVLSAPAKDDTPTYVIWVNEKDYKWENIISNASCTTNCLGPIAKIIDDAFGIEKGLVTTIHSYTASQKILDIKSNDKRRSRAAGVNMIPTTTWAAKAMSKIMPQLKWKLHWQSVRVPTPNVSLVDANFVLDNKKSGYPQGVPLQDILKVLENASQTTHENILEYDTDFRVSSDIMGNPYSSIVASDMIQIVDWNMLKIMSWYDNEWGYSNRLVDMCVLINKK